MTQVLLLKPKDAIRIFKKFGWPETRRPGGSRIILTKEGSISTLSVPNHSEVAKRHFKIID